MKLREYLKENIVILDGGMGTLLQARGLQPGEAPEAVFALAEGQKAVAVYEYCNLHGLWKAEL